MKRELADTVWSFPRRRGNSIIEVMVVITVITIGISGAYQIAFRGNAMATNTEDRIKAINIAREWLEIVENIRDSNWVKLSSDYQGCWDVLNSNVLCIGSGTGAGVIEKITPGSYVTSKLANDSWTLLPVAPGGTWAVYRAKFPIYLDGYGLVTQTGSTALNCTPTIASNCITRFTREIAITRPADYSEIWIESVVTWMEPGKTTPYEIRIPYTLTNWKYEFYKD